MNTPPGYFEPRVRRTFSEWLYDLIIPPSPYEAEHRSLLLEQAKRTALRTAVQAERIKARMQRVAERERAEKEIRDRYVLVAIWKFDFLHDDKNASIFVELREISTHRKLVPVRLVFSNGTLLPESNLLSSWGFAQTVAVYVKYLRPWMDGLLNDVDLADAKGVTLAGRSSRKSKK